MVVEDTLTVRKLMQQLLLKIGFERVDCYENGSKGLEAMMAGPVDIVFSDVQMPIMTGPEVIGAFSIHHTFLLYASGHFLLFCRWFRDFENGKQKHCVPR